VDIVELLESIEEDQSKKDESEDVDEEYQEFKNVRRVRGAKYSGVIRGHLNMHTASMVNIVLTKMRSFRFAIMICGVQVLRIILTRR
jgi:uncharacterized protein YfbU (UPF0304 family)